MNKNICGLDGIISATTDRQIEQQQPKPLISIPESRIGYQFPSLGYGDCESICKCLDHACSNWNCECLEPNNE